MIDFERQLGAVASDMAASLDILLPQPDGAEARVLEAMRYAVMGPGKRFRAFLVMAGSAIFNLASNSATRVAAAVECLHAYALVHDDLPALDDAATRRGRPSTHIAFDEPTAILAGDALLTFAFETLSAPETHPDPFLRSELVLSLAKASGARSLIGGQMIDVQAGQALDMGALMRLQRLKVGALFAFCCEAGAILARAPLAQRQALHAFAHDLSVAYQMADELLKASSHGQGLRAQRDREAGRPTFLAHLGEERTHSQSRLLAQQSVRHLEIFDSRADPLRAAAHYAVERRS